MNRVAQYALSALPGGERSAVEAHLLECGSCRAWREQVEFQEKSLSALPRKKTPPLLDLRVAEEIRRPDAFVLRWVRRLRRLSAPSALWGRVREEMVLSEWQGRRPLSPVLRWSRWIGAAAAGILVVWGGVLFLGSKRPPRHLPMVFLDVQDPSALSPASAGMVEGAFGVPPGRAERKP